MLNSLRRSFGMSPSSSNIQADYVGNSDVPAGVFSPSNKPNTFIPLRRSNSFTNLFSSSRSSSPVKENMEQSTTKGASSPDKASSTQSREVPKQDPVLAFLVLLDKQGRQKQRYPIQSLTTTMGRAEDNDVRFLVSDVSRHHCTIEIEIEQGHSSDGTRAFLQVLGANGVFLNGVQAFPAPRGAGRYELHSGDSIVVAKRSFVFELPQPASSASQSSTPNLFSSPVKASTQSAVPQTPANSNKRQVRMSLVNAAQIDTPARASASSSSKLASPANANDAEREARRADCLQRFMQSANVSPSKISKKKARQSLTSSSTTANMFTTPVKNRNATVEPMTAPPKQVSFNLYSNSYSGRLSPVKQMRMMPPLDTMNEEQDGSFRSDNQQPEDSQEPQEAEAEEDSPDSPHNESSEDIVIVEELEQEPEQAGLVTAAAESEPQVISEDIRDAENSENIPPPTPDGSSTPNGSPRKSGSPKRAKRRSSFFGRAGPLRGISLGFYAEERTEPESTSEEAQAEAPVSEKHADEFLDAPDVEPAPMEEEVLGSEAEASPVPRRVSSKPMMLGISKTPSPVKQQHFVGLTPLPRRPRLSLTTRRRVSLRTQTLLRSSEAYADRLFLPPPPPTPSSPGPSGLSKSMSMPSNLSAMAPMQPPPAFDASTSIGAEHDDVEDDSQYEQAHEVDFESQLDPALREEEAEKWKDSEDDEDEVDQSLSVLSQPSPPKAPIYNFSPVKISTLPQFATPQPMSKSHARRTSMPPVGAAGAKPSNRSALIRLQISGAGERMIHESSRKIEIPETSSSSEQSSPSKSRKVVRVSDVGLPATEMSMGFDLVQDSAAEQESETIYTALNNLFTAEAEELTDDEMPAERDEEEEQEEIVQISAKEQESPSRPPAAAAMALQLPQTPVALNSVRHLFSAASAAPATPDMHGLASMLQASPEKTPQYGTLGDRMRANLKIAELLSPVKSSPKNKAASSSSPAKGRRSVRRSEAAELVLPLPPAPRTMASRPSLLSPSVTPLPESVVAPLLETTPEPPAFEAELHVTLFDATAMDTENEAIAQALAQEQVYTASVATQESELEVVPAQQHLEEVRTDEVEEQELAPLPEADQITQIEAEQEPSEPTQENDATVVTEVPTEQVLTPVATLEAAEEDVTEAATVAQVNVEASPTKVRAPRRAVSASPVKRTARSASPTKRAMRSSPVKHAPTPVAEVISEDLVELPPVQVQEHAEPQPDSEKIETESPSKPVRRAGGRKAKQAATEAISATLVPEPTQQSPEKPTRRTKTTVGKKFEVEETQNESEKEEAEIEQVEEIPKRATRVRVTRAAATATKVVRTTRTRSAKSGGEGVPSSSAGYGDDEASEEEVQHTLTRSKRTTATRTRIPTAARTKSTRATKATAAAVESSDTDHAEDSAGAEAEREQVPVAKTRARPTRAQAAAPTTRGRGKAKTEPEETATSSSTTTRFGRTTRRTAAAAK